MPLRRSYLHPGVTDVTADSRTPPGDETEGRPNPMYQQPLTDGDNYTANGGDER